MKKKLNGSWLVGCVSYGRWCLVMAISSGPTPPTLKRFKEKVNYCKYIVSLVLLYCHRFFTEDGENFSFKYSLRNDLIGAKPGSQQKKTIFKRFDLSWPRKSEREKRCVTGLRKKIASTDPKNRNEMIRRQISKVPLIAVLSFLLSWRHFFSSRMDQYVLSLNLRRRKAGLSDAGQKARRHLVVAAAGGRCVFPDYANAGL